MPDLRRLQFFLTVAEERNFTRAAERLHIAQPALSRQVRQLEDELGVQLLHRTTHEFELTDAGRFLVERGPALLVASDELWRSVKSFGAGDRGALLLAYGPSVSYETAPQLLTAVSERSPDIGLSTELRPTAEILDAVRDGALDLGLVRCPPALVELESRTIRREPLGVLLRREHPLASRPTIAVADLGGEMLLMHSREANPGHFDTILQLCRDRGLEPRVRLRTLSFDPAQTPLVQGEAVAIVGSSAQVGQPAGLVWLPIEPPAAMDIGVVVRRYGRPPALDRLLETAAAVAAELGWLDR